MIPSMVEVAAVIIVTRTLTYYKSTSLLYHEGCLSVPPSPTASAALWRGTGSTWRSPWTTSTRRQRPQPAAVPAVLCIHAVATTSYVQQPPICDADAALLRQHGPAVSWRTSCPSSPDVPGGTTWRRAVCGVNFDIQVEIG